MTNKDMVLMECPRAYAKLDTDGVWIVVNPQGSNNKEVLGHGKAEHDAWALAAYFM